GSGARRLIHKVQPSNGPGFSFLIDASRNMLFGFNTNSTNRRNVISTGDTVSDGDTITLKYDGSIDTNDGLDRVTFEINGVATGKSLSFTTGTLPANIPNVADHLGFADILDSNGLRNGVAMYRGNAF